MAAAAASAPASSSRRRARAAAREIRFLSKSNVCGQTLLKLVARGNAIIAELSRLGDHLPPAFLGELARDLDAPIAEKYAPILFDFRYFKEPDLFDSRISRTPELSDLDDECDENFAAVAERFYRLFESMAKYYEDLHKYFQELLDGFYPQFAIEQVALNRDGKQLLTESLFLLGTMLLLLDRRIPGAIRERIVVAHFRWKGEALVPTIDSVRTLARNTGFLLGEKRLAGYPETFFARFPVQEEILRNVIGRLRADDMYEMERVYPSPEHRSFAVANQARMAYVILFFTPKILALDRPLMRELVDRHFLDNWVVPVYMEFTVDLAQEWAVYAAANDVLNAETLKVPRARELAVRHTSELTVGERELKEYLTEGTLTEAFVVDHYDRLLQCLRRCNTSLRWTLLHRNTVHPKLKPAINEVSFPPERLLDLLLRTAQLEFRLKGIVSDLLDSREVRWTTASSNIEARLRDLARYFRGETSFSGVDDDESLGEWFDSLATKVAALDYSDPTLAGRKIQRVMVALGEGLQFEAIETSAVARDYIGASRDELQGMLRLANVPEDALTMLDVVSDLAYAWGLLAEFVPFMHARIQRDASAVSLMRATFLKLVSVLDAPMLRILAAKHPDAELVAEHYSSKLVAFLRRVMEVVPRIVFEILTGIVRLQTAVMTPIPIKFETEKLHLFAQLESRFDLARRTHEISVFTQGVLAQHETLIGVIKVNPRQILNDGIRKQLVGHICAALHESLLFDLRSGRGRNPRANVAESLLLLRRRLEGLRTSFEYIQDFIGITGLRMWQEEFTRVLAFNAEQEANRYTRKKVLARDSVFQSAAIPILVLRSDPADLPHSENFVGRVLYATMALTAPTTTIFSPSAAGWYDASGAESVGLGYFSLLLDAIGVPGLVGLDRVISFRLARTLNETLRVYGAEFGAGLRVLLQKFHEDAMPLTSLQRDTKIYGALASRVRKPLQYCTSLLLEIGQLQLLRRSLSHELRFAARMDSNLLFGALAALNASVLNDIRRHYHSKDTCPYPTQSNPLLPELARYLEHAGIAEPTDKIYITTKPQPLIAIWFVLLLVEQLPNLVFDREFDTLVRRRTKDELDGFPLVVGLTTVLRQLHPSVTRLFLAYSGQYIRTAIHGALAEKRPQPIPPEAINYVLILRQVARILRVPDRVLHANVPAFVFESVDIPAPRA